MGAGSLNLVWTSGGRGGLFGLIFLSLLFLSTHVLAGDDGRAAITFSELYKKGRPPNIYSLAYSANDNICSAALALRNEPALVPPRLRLPYDYAGINTALFLQTRAGVEWDEGLLRWNDTEDPRPEIDSAQVDIFNSGAHLHVFRVESFLGGLKRHTILALPVDVVPTVIERLEEAPDGTPIMRLRSWAHDRQVTPRVEVGAPDLGYSDHLFLEALRLAERNYVLAMSSAGMSNGVNAYLLEFTDYKSQKLICSFNGRFELIME